MNHIPSIEVLKATHDFPTHYTFKAIGKAEADFIERVVTAAKEAMGSDQDPTHYAREASGGRHVAVTLEMRLASAEQIRSVYERILGLEGLVLLF